MTFGINTSLHNSHKYELWEIQRHVRYVKK